jgi:hypothetical protein
MYHSRNEQKRNVVVKIRTKSGRAEFGTLIGQFLALFIRKVTEGLLDELEAEILNTVNPAQCQNQPGQTRSTICILPLGIFDSIGATRAR